MPRLTFATYIFTLHCTKTSMNFYANSHGSLSKRRFWVASPPLCILPSMNIFATNFQHERILVHLPLSQIYHGAAGALVRRACSAYFKPFAESACVTMNLPLEASQRVEALVILGDFDKGQFNVLYTNAGRTERSSSTVCHLPSPPR